NSGKCLDVVGGNTGNQARLQQWACSAYDQQNFYLDGFGTVSSGTTLPAQTFSYGTGATAGSFNITNASTGSSNWINSQPPVIEMTGDFNGDGKTDIALRNTAGAWPTLPVYFSNGDGTFTFTNASISSYNLINGN